MICNICQEDVGDFCDFCREALNPKSFICYESCYEQGTKHFCSRSCVEEAIVEEHEGQIWEGAEAEEEDDG